MSTEIVITPAASALFPDLGVAVLVVRELDRRNLAATASAALALAIEKMAAITDYDGVSAAPEVVRWRDAFRDMKLRPAEYRSSLEALMRMWVNGRRPDGVGLVDLYNSVSLASGTPLGAVDARKLGDRSITLRMAVPGTDAFEPVSGSVRLKSGADAVSYCVGDRIICYALNHRDSSDFGIEDESRDVLFFAEWAFADQRLAARAALDLLGRLLQDAGAEISRAEVGATA